MSKKEDLLERIVLSTARKLAASNPKGIFTTVQVYRALMGGNYQVNNEADKIGRIISDSGIYKKEGRVAVKDDDNNISSTEKWSIKSPNFNGTEDQSIEASI